LQWVDDNEFNLFTLQKILELSGVLIDKRDFAYDGKNSIEKIESR